MAEPTTPDDHRALRRWYLENRRDLPWRRDRDAYRIWISEVMLQQTTVTAVIPFYERFLEKFPDAKSLARAPEGEVLKAWTGLGYYSRARNLHKAAKHLAAHGFPRTAAELLELPGFGPYTAAAVASIAFDDRAGVLDGNVIRVLSRRYGWKLDWWTGPARKRLQTQANAFAEAGAPADINQALMELGATVCTPKSPVCLLCPWSKSCVARARDLVAQLPKPRPRRETEIWVWDAHVPRRAGKIGLVKNEGGPFMRGQMIFPGRFARVKTAPKAFDVRGGITHHDIFIRLTGGKTPAKNVTWVDPAELATVNPSSLLTKVLNASEKNK